MIGKVRLHAATPLADLSGLPAVWDCNAGAWKPQVTLSHFPALRTAMVTPSMPFLWNPMLLSQVVSAAFGMRRADTCGVTMAQPWSMCHVQSLGMNVTECVGGLAHRELPAIMLTALIAS